MTKKQSDGAFAGMLDGFGRIFGGTPVADKPPEADPRKAIVGTPASTGRCPDSKKS